MSFQPPPADFKIESAQAIEDAMGDAKEAAENHPVPETLAQEISERLQEKPELPWDAVVAKLAARKIFDG